MTPRRERRGTIPGHDGGSKHLAIESRHSDLTTTTRSGRFASMFWRSA